MKKQRPEEYKQYLKGDALRAKYYRLTLSDEKKKRASELAAARMRKMREKNKQKSATAKKLGEKKGAIPTRQETEQKEKLREKWSEQKRKQRAQMTGQKRACVNMRRRENDLSIPFSQNATSSVLSDVTKLCLLNVGQSVGQFQRDDVRISCVFYMGEHTMEKEIEQEMRASEEKQEAVSPDEGISDRIVDTEEGLTKWSQNAALSQARGKEGERRAKGRRDRRGKGDYRGEEGLKEEQEVCEEENGQEQEEEKKQEEAERQEEKEEERQEEQEGKRQKQMIIEVEVEMVERVFWMKSSILFPERDSAKQEKRANAENMKTVTVISTLPIITGENVTEEQMRTVMRDATEDVVFAV
ncbi:hypothetical protein WMY93_002127 [Mugilogobius chulae]|uniref:Uncharacterized protein n=1 Tax=Mugilogobius chulae TaxID=88201 RepID=A0AAW0PSW7_9GOBI